MTMKTTSKPSLWKLALEMRAGAEWASHYVLRPSLKHWPKVEPGIPVLVIPGLAMPDLSMLPLRQSLMRLGYCPYAWDMGFNTGPSQQQIDAIQKRIALLAQEHGQPVGLVGWSLGGAVARAAAAMAPENVRCVVGLASPLGRDVSTNLETVFNYLSGMDVNDKRLEEWLRQPLAGVPVVSIASVDDGLLAWESSVIDTQENQETILLRGVSHLGFPAHPLALWLVHDRLRQNSTPWEHYSPTSSWEKLLIVDR